MGLPIAGYSNADSQRRKAAEELYRRFFDEAFDQHIQEKYEAGEISEAGMHPEEHVGVLDRSWEESLVDFHFELTPEQEEAIKQVLKG